MGLRSWVPVLGWCAATLASIGLATVALQPVLRAAAPDPVAAAPPAAAGAPTTTPTAATAAPSNPTGRATPTATATAAPRVTTPAPTGPTATEPADPPPPESAVVDGWTVTSDAAGEPTYTRTFRVDGGVAVIRMTPGVVDLVSATPDPGYTVDVTPGGAGNLAVQFTAAGHYVIVHALWQDGPVALVSDSAG